MTEPTAPTVHLVEVSHTSHGATGLIEAFSDRDAAEQFADQVQHPFEAKVTSRAVRTSAPTLRTTYRLATTIVAPRERGLFAQTSLGGRYNPEYETPTVHQHLPGPAGTSHEEPASPATLTVARSAHATSIEVVGSDERAVRATFVRAYEDEYAHAHGFTSTTKGTP